MKQLYAFLLALPCYGHAQTLTTSLALPQLRIEALAPRFRTALSFASNPAALAGADRFKAAAATERRFAIADLGSNALALVLPVQGNAFGLHLTSGGNRSWREWSAALAYGRKLGALATGLSFQYIQSGTGAQRGNVLSTTGGLSMSWSESLCWGISVQHPLSLGSSGKGARVLLPRYALVVCWQQEHEWYVGAELSSDGAAVPAVLLAAACTPARGVAVKAGFDTGARGFFLASSIAVHQFTIQLSVLPHRELGLTPALLVAYPNP